MFGLDLFNYGYYWEAHEVWESVWHSCGRAGLAADFIKGLIKLAAAGVKAREGRPEGVRRHARRAVELFNKVASQLPPGQTCYFGLSLERLIDLANETARGLSRESTSTGVPADVVFQFALYPDDESKSV